jgi:hypothetical protein
MGEMKKEVRAIGQRVSGLQAGETYTFVLKRPKLTADLTNARRCIKMTTGYLETSKLIMEELEQAHQRINLGDLSSAQDSFQKAKNLKERIGIILGDANGPKEYAKEDATDSPGETKSAYDLGAKAATLSIKHAEWIAKGIDEAVRAVGAFVEESLNRANSQ